MSRIRRIITGIINRIRGRRQVQPTQWDWGYRCTWTDERTGIEITNSWHVVTIDSDTNYQRASARARQWMFSHPPPCVVQHQRGGGQVRLRCERRGAIVGHT